jgi:LppX_LprAFG lipoprotein
MREAKTALVLLCLLVSPAWAQLGPGSSSDAIQTSLNRTADAILALKSARFSLKREGPPAFLDEKNGITFTIADCGYAAPDRVSCNVKVALKNGTIVQLTRVWVPDGVFQSNPLTRQFGRVPAADTNFNGVLLFTRRGIPEILRTAVQKTQVVGREKIQNADVLHLKGEVSGEKLNPLIGATLNADLTYPVDLWLDEKSGNPARFHVAESEGKGWLIDIFGIGDAIDIPTPQLPASKPPA